MTEPIEYTKPVPIPDEVSKPFFDGAREHQLMIQQCSTCGAVMWPVQARCNNCLSPTVAWRPSSGRGTLYSFALMHQVYHPGFAGEVPYNIAQVDLEEGLRILTAIVGCSNADLQIGMPLEVTFEAITDEVTLPKFKPIG
jgi:uncharacterized protein